MTSSNIADARQPMWQRQILELQERARRAFLEQDISGMELVLSDDFIVNSPINRILTKSEMLDLLQRGIIRHFSYEEQVELMKQKQDFVIVMGSDIVTNAPEGPTIRRRFTNVWVEAGDSWQLVARHAHQIHESPRS